jgi:ribonuclease BN (tRNA processing enzyme)
MNQTLTHYSRGLYSTWTILHPYNLMIDAGEGFCSYLRNRMYGINTIYLSHEHMDHMAGLVSLFGLRAKGAGDRTKPLKILSRSPAALDLAKNIYELVTGTRTPVFDVTFEHIGLGQRVQLNAQTFMEPVTTVHCKDSTGLLIYMESKKLKVPYLKNELFMKDITSGKRAVTEKHLEKAYTPLFLNVLDNAGIDFTHSRFVPKGVRFMIEDLTFPEGHDSEFIKHNDLEGVAKNLKLLEPKHVLLSHVSSRYSHADHVNMSKSIASKLYDLGVPRNIIIEVFSPRNGLSHPYTHDIKL